LIVFRAARPYPDSFGLKAHIFSDNGNVSVLIVSLLKNWHFFAWRSRKCILPMFRNYYKIAIRRIARSRFYATINIVGLSMGIAVTMLIASYCWSEWRVNRQLNHADRQFILTDEWKNPNMGFPLTTLGPLAKALKENYPSLVANYYRFDGITSTISYGDKHFREGIQIGDSTLLTMYGFPLLYGDPRTALNQPFTAVITVNQAIKYFGKTDVVGQNLTIESFSGGKQDFRITGVMQEPLRNSVTWLVEAFPSHVFVPTANLAFFSRNMDWPNSSIGSYVELQKGVQPESLAGAIDHLVKANADPNVYANLKVRVTPLTSYYLTGNQGTVEKMLYLLSFIAIFILLMAVINFVNLSVAQSSARMKEIGIRKVLGSLRRQLRWQFLTESVLLAVFATVAALGLYAVFANFVSGMLGKDIPSLTQLPIAAWTLLLAFSVGIGLLAGLYPAFLLSSMGSVEVLKGKLVIADSNIFLRKGLVSFQFVTASVVLIGAIIVSQQIDLFFSDRLGYNKEYIVAAQLPRDWSPKGVQRLQTMHTAFLNTAGVKDMTLSYEIPNGMNGGNRGAFREGGDSTRAVVAQMLVTDEHYAATYGIPLAAGVYFHGAGESAVQDSLRVVINETAAKGFGWKIPGDAVGQRIRLFGDPQPYTISGIVKDFHFDAMGQPIQPEIFAPVSRFVTYRYFSFKLKPGNIGATMAALQRQWSTLLPGAAFEYKFMDEYLQSIYTNEMHLKKAASSATVIALVIVLLGIAGLLSLSIQKRMKEIAIRKVVGASVTGILRLFLREYLPLLGIAGLVAAPVAYLVMQRWLEGYATRITITPWPFMIAILSLALVIGVLVVLQTARAAMANPVKSLKAE
jgi:ABC-type antimicrobial peptide transport system permease subunit